MNLKDKLLHPVFALIRDVADREGIPVYVVGGYVRDLLIDRPSTDIDCTVAGDGIRLSRMHCGKYSPGSHSDKIRDTCR